METLTSVRNPALKEIRKAILRGSLTAQGHAVVEGFHLLEEALRGPCEIDSIFTSEAARARVESLAGPRFLRMVTLGDALFQTVAATETSQGVVALVRPPLRTLAHVLEGYPLIVVLDRIQDPGNAGAIIRAAEAFGATGVVLLRGSVNPYNPKALRASAGSIFRVALTAAVDEPVLLAALEQSQVGLVAMSPRGRLPLDQCRLAGRCAIAIGSEGQGVSAGLRARAIEVRIPTVGVESLNAAMSAAVVLYEAQRQRTGGGTP